MRGGRLSFLAASKLVERVGQRQPIRVRARIRHHAHGLELLERRYVSAGVFIEQRQVVMSVVKIGLQNDRAFQRRTDVIRAQAPLIGENRVVVTELGVGDALIHRSLPIETRAFGIAFVQRDQAERGGNLGGIGQGVCQSMEECFGAIELAGSQK